VVSTRNILSTPHYVAGSKAVATMPTPIARLFVQRYGLAAIPLPLEAWRIDYSMLWHQQRAADRPLQWALEEIRRWALLRAAQDQA
jgi:DNA-binding transcriptional LysR family regulator